MLQNKTKPRKRLLPVFLLAAALTLGGGAAWQNSLPYSVGETAVTAYAETTTDTWDGATVDTDWYDETATSFTISTCAEFAGFSRLVSDGKTFEGKTVTQTANLDLDDYAWMPIGIFEGTYDGGFLSINGLNVNVEGGSRKGLFSWIGEKGTVKNVRIESGSVSGTSYLGAVAGQNEGLVEACYNAASVTGSNNEIGGIVGINFPTGTVKNCLNRGMVTDTDATDDTNWVGGIVGRNQGAVVSCLNYENVNFGEGIGGAIVGSLQGGTIENCVAEDMCWGGVLVGSIGTTDADGVEGVTVVYSVQSDGRGRAAWMLNGGKSDGDWGADMSADYYELPTLKANGGKTVYRVKDCAGAEAYSNENADVGHTGELCTVCNKYFLPLTYEYVSETESYTVTGANTSTDGWAALADNAAAQADIQIVIPATYNDGTNGEAKVTAIGEEAFYPFLWNLQEGYAVTSLTLGENLETIGDYAFHAAAEALTGTVTLPAGLKTVGAYAFYSSKISSVVFNANLETIGDYAFAACYSLTGTLTLPAGLKTIGASAFNASGYNEALVLNDGLETIGEQAFAGGGFTNVLRIPESVTAIGEQAFYNTDFAAVYLNSNTDVTYGSEPFYNGDYPVIAHSAEAYAKYKTEGHALATYGYLTYEAEVTFVVYPDAAESGEVKMTKLYGADATYVKGADGVWAKDEANAFPAVTPPTKKVFVEWNSAKDGSGSAITDGVLTATTWYAVYENNYCEEHPGYTYDSLDDGTHKVTCTDPNCCYSETVECTSLTSERTESTETARGYYTYTCDDCGYSYVDDYFCDHVGATYTQIYDGEEHTLTHLMSCGVEDCGEERTVGCVIVRLPVVTEEGESYTLVGCYYCDYHVKEDYVCLHINATYEQNLDENDEPTGTHKIVCSVCETTVESEACVQAQTKWVPDYDTETGTTVCGEIQLAVCHCGYEKEISYECYHVGYTVTQIFDNEKATWTHEFVCGNEKCNEKTLTEKCLISYSEDVIEDTGIYYQTKYCRVCEYEETSERTSCYAAYTCTQIYAEDGVTATGTHKFTCTEGCDDDGAVANCSFYLRADYTDGVLSGYSYVCSDCGYSYAAETVDFSEAVVINGVALTLAKPYYVNGENGAAGTAYAEEPETWNAKLEAGKYEGYYVLTLNGLNVKTDGSVFFAIAYTEVLEIVLTKGSVNVLTVTAPEPELFQSHDYKYGGIGAKDSFAEDLDISGKGTLTIDVSGTVDGFSGYRSWEAIGIYSADDSDFENATLNVTVASDNPCHGLMIEDNFEAKNVTINVTIESGGNYAYGIEGEDDTEFYGCSINIAIGGKAEYAYGIDSDDYLTVFSDCDVTITIDCAADYIYGIQSGDGGDESVSFIIQESQIDVTIGDSTWYTAAIKADDDDENYFDMEITGSVISVKTGDVLGEYGELYGIYGSLGDQIFKDNIITIELGDCLFGGIGGIVPEWDEGEPDANTTFEDCEITIVTGDAGMWNIGIEASEDSLTIKDSKITVVLGTGCLYDDDYSVVAIEGVEDVTVTNSELDLTVGGGDEAYGLVAWCDGLVIENSEIVIAVGNGRRIAGIYARETYGEREALFVKNSTVDITYGLGREVYGIFAKIEYPDWDYCYGALVIEDSTVYVEGTLRTYEELAEYERDEDTLSGVQNVAIYVDFDDYYANFEEVVLIKNSDVTALAGYGMMSMGLSVAAGCQDYGYVERIVRVENSSVLAEGGFGMMSAGIVYSANSIESEYGIYSRNSELTAKGGLGVGMSVGLMNMGGDDYEADLYVRGGSVSAVAYDFYEDEQMLKLFAQMAASDSSDSLQIQSFGLMVSTVYVQDAELEAFGTTVGCWASVYYDEDAYMFVNGTFGMDGAYVTSYDEPYSYLPYMKITKEMGEFPPVYVGGVALNAGEYYVNGENGGAGTTYEEEPEEWNAALTYDAENEKYVLTLNGLYVAAEGYGVWNSAIFSYADLEIVLVEGSENVIVVPETAANGKAVYAIETYAYRSHEEIAEYEGFFAGGLTLTGKGGLTVVGALANTELVWDFETYVWKTAEESELVYSGVEELTLGGEESYLTIAYHVHEKGELVKTETHHWYECVGCEEILEYATHTAGEWIVDQAATCVGTGERHKECTLCGKTLETETIAAKGHSYGEVTYVWSADYSSCVATSVCTADGSHVATEIVTTTSVTDAATCTADGKTVYTATFQNAAFETQTKEVKLDATGHSYGEATYSWNADYTECTATRTCATDSSHVETETVTVTSVTDAATCTTDGKTVYTATFQNAAFVAQTKEVKLDATGHSYGEWTVVTEATKESAGLREKECAHCGDKIVELIPELGELPDGAIVAISAGSTAAVGLGAFAIVWFVLKKKKL